MLEAGLDGIVERAGVWHWVEVSHAHRTHGAGGLLLLFSSLSYMLS